MNTFKDALKNIQDSKKIGVLDLMLVVPCSNTNRAMKLLILGVGFCAWFQNFNWLNIYYAPLSQIVGYLRQRKI